MATESVHLVVLVHGLWGNTTHFEYIKSQLRLADPSLLIHVTGSHERYKTYDGIDVCGQRVANEIQWVMAQHNVRRFSIVGYSLGGLISRYAVGVLYHRQLFTAGGIEPVNFVTFCSPHVGVHTPSSALMVKAFNAIVPFLLASSGKQMFLTDAEAHDEPLLVRMVQPGSVFHEGLAAFANRALYANIINDKRASWFTLGISSSDPFHSMAEGPILELNWVDGYANVVVDLSQGYRKMTSGAPGFYRNPLITGPQALRQVLSTAWLWTVAILNLLLFVPIWVLWFSVSLVLQRTMSYKRVRKYLLDNPECAMRSVEVPSASPQSLSTRSYNQSHSRSCKRSVTVGLFTHMEDCADEVMDSMWSALMARSSNVPLGEGVRSFDDPEEEFELPVSQAQAYIIQRLNAMGWRKFPINIRATAKSHAAAVVRHGDPNFGEGKVVVRHFIKEVFTF